jgi:hypothetical protein
VSVVGCKGVQCQLCLSVEVVCCWLSGVGHVEYWLMIVGCPRRWFLFGCWLSGVGCRALIVDCLCRLSFSFPLKVSSPALTLTNISLRTTFCSQIHHPCLVDILASGIRLSYGPIRYPMPCHGRPYLPSRGLRIWLQSSAVLHFSHRQTASVCIYSWWMQTWTALPRQTIRNIIKSTYFMSALHRFRFLKLLLTN